MFLFCSAHHSHFFTPTFVRFSGDGKRRDNFFSFSIVEKTFCSQWTEAVWAAWNINRWSLRSLSVKFIIRVASQFMRKCSIIWLHISLWFILFARCFVQSNLISCRESNKKKLLLRRNLRDFSQLHDFSCVVISSSYQRRIFSRHPKTTTKTWKHFFSPGEPSRARFGYQINISYRFFLLSYSLPTFLRTPRRSREICSLYIWCLFRMMIVVSRISPNVNRRRGEFESIFLGS